MSGTSVLGIDKPSDLSLDSILSKVDSFTDESYVSSTLNVIVPLAGDGSRFSKAGYNKPKPLVDVNGKPMIQRVIENLNIDANYIFLVKQSHIDDYAIDTLLTAIKPNCKIVPVSQTTEGAACTLLLADGLIQDGHLLIVNSDQLIDWDSNTIHTMISTGVDGCVFCFKNDNPKWSFARLDSNGRVLEIAEKRVISDNATTGHYYWNKGSDFSKYAHQMIQKNIRVNNEFYVAPVFNEAIAGNQYVSTMFVDDMNGLGTPEDLTLYLESYA